jgi:TonB family protein
MLLIFCAGSPCQETASDYQVEAAYLFNFAKLAEWPNRVLPDGAPLLIGVVGGDEDFVQVLTATTSGKVAGSHPVQVRHLASAADLKSCAVVFFRSSERHHIHELVAALDGESILLVGEDKSFLQQGGAINLVLENGIIHFELNPDALERSGIHFSAQVLAQAKIEKTQRSDTAEAGASRKVERKVPPDYPQLAQQMKLKGIVQLEAVVARDGSVKKVKLIGGHPVFVQAALDAVMKWKYVPASQETVELIRVSFGEGEAN